MYQKIIGVIPARYKSTRFPGKPLVNLLGKPMVIWVAELSAQALGKENVYVATEDERIVKVVEDFGFKAVMTFDAHLTGTDRLAEVATKVDADIYINIQGDEPTVDPSTILEVIKVKQDHMDKVVNAMAYLSKDEDPENINIPKVISTESNDLVYMSRVALPGFKAIENKPREYFKQICIYAFTQQQLLDFNKFGRKSYLERHEDIEILRYLDLNIPVKMVIVNGGTYAVDVKEDIKVVENRLKEIHKL